MSIKVKICGIKNITDALISIEAGADFLGFNFVPNSKRFIPTELAHKIINRLAPNIKIVGVFQNEKIDCVISIINFLKLDFVQLHGSESIGYCNNLTNYVGVIKSFALPSIFDVEDLLNKMEKYDADFFLLDREIQGKGPILNFHLIREIARNYRIFLAGGLNSENVGRAIDLARPYGVDVASGIESDGREDIEKIRLFIRNVRD